MGRLSMLGPLQHLRPLRELKLFSQWSRSVMAAAMGAAGLAVGLICSSGFSTVSAQDGANWPPLIPNHYIVVLKDTVSDPVAAALELERAGGLTVEIVYGSALNGFEAIVPSDRVRALIAD